MHNLRINEEGNQMGNWLILFTWKMAIKRVHVYDKIQTAHKYLSFLVPPKPNIKFPRYIAGNGHSYNTNADQLD